jgi:MFS family permease
VAADRLPRKMIIQTTQLVNGLNTASLAILAMFGLLSFEHLMFSAVLQGGTNAMLMPARQSIIQDLVGPDRLMNAIGLSTTGQNLMQTVGPGLGGLLMTFLNPASAFWVMASMYFIAFLFTVRIPARPLFATANRRVSPGLRGSLSDLVEGMRYVTRDRTIRTLIAVNFIIVVCSMPYGQMMPGFVDEVLHKGAAEMGVLLSIAGVGSVIGSLVVASLPARDRGLRLVQVALAVGATLIAFATIEDYYLIMPVMLALGAGSAFRQSIGQVLIQSYSSQEMRGRVASVWFMQIQLTALGTFFVGVLAEWFGPQISIGGLAAFMSVAMIAALLWVPRIKALQ